MPIELSSVFGKLEGPLQVPDLLGNGCGRGLLVRAILDESLSVLVSNFLHVDIAYALDEIAHGFRRLFESTGSNLSLRTCEAVLKKVREPHRYRADNIHPQL